MSQDVESCFYIKSISNPIGNIAAHSVNTVGTCACYVIFAYVIILALISVIWLITIARRHRKIRSTLSEGLSLCRYINIRFDKAVQASLICYLVKSKFARHYWFLSTSFTFIFGAPIVIPFVSQVFSMMSKESSFTIPVYWIVLGQFYAMSQFFWIIFVFMVLRSRNEYAFARANAVTQTGFTFQERTDIIKWSVRRTLLSFLSVFIVLDALFVPMIIAKTYESDLVRPGGQQVLMLYFIMIGGYLTCHVLVIRNYLNYETKLLKYQSEGGKLDQKFFALSAFIRDYSPIAIIKNINVDDYNGSINTDELKLHLYLAKLEENIQLINEQPKFLRLPQNIGDVGIVTKIFIVLCLGLVAVFLITVITYHFGAFNIAFVICSCAVLTCFVLLQPAILPMMLTTKFIFGETKQENYNINESEIEIEQSRADDPFYYSLNSEKE